MFEPAFGGTRAQSKHGGLNERCRICLPTANGIPLEIVSLINIIRNKKRCTENRQSVKSNVILHVILRQRTRY